MPPGGCRALIFLTVLSAFFSLIAVTGDCHQCFTLNYFNKFKNSKKKITDLFPFGENLTKWLSKEQLCCWKLCCCCLFAQLCVTLCDPMNCSPPGSSVHGIFQARILKWVAISFSRGSSLHKDQTWVSCNAGGFFIAEPPGKPWKALHQP